MKIAVLTRSTTKHFTSGGMETHLQNLLKGLSAENNEIYVITTDLDRKMKSKVNLKDNSSDSFSSLEENGIKYFFIKDTTPGLNPITLWESGFKKLGLLKRTEDGVEGSVDFFEASNTLFHKLSEDVDFDLVLSQSTGGYGLRNFKVPLYSIIHGTIKGEIKNRSSTKRTFKQNVRFYVVDLPKWNLELTKNYDFFASCKKIIAVNNILKSDFINDYPGLKDKVEVINNGVDTNIFKPSNSKYPYFTALYVGRMDNEKGVDVIINAMSRLKKDNLPVKLKLIGSGNDIDSFKNLSIDLKVTEDIEFLGEVSNEKLPEYYQNSHIFVFPSRREEGHPMTISEAFCSGLPVIATKKGGLRSLIDDGINGFFIDGHKLDKILSSKIKYLYENRDKLADMSKNAAKKGFEQYSQKTMILKYLSIFNND